MDFSALLSAIKTVLLKRTSIRAASRIHGVDRITLGRHTDKVANHFTEISSVSDVDLLEFIRTSNMHLPANMVFSTPQEKALVEYIQKCGEHDYTLSDNELRVLAYQLAIKLQLDYPECWNDDSKAGRRWCRRFMKRNNLGEDDQRRIIFDPLVAGRGGVGVVESKPSTSRDSCVSQSALAASQTATVLSLLDEIGPLHGVVEKKPLKRELGAMDNCELISEIEIDELKPPLAKLVKATSHHQDN